MNTYKNLKTYIKKEKYIIIFSILLGLLIMSLTISVTKGYFKGLQNSISNEVIRFHILANSNSEDDQNLKMEIKKEVIKMLEKELSSSVSKKQTKLLLQKNLKNIENKAKEIITKNGYNYPVSAKIGYSYFPTKSYGDITMPNGKYEALIIKIGKAEGKNWWCVMFPPLCFVDITMEKVPEKDKDLLKNIFDKDEYDLITKDKNSPSIKIKFKLLEFFNKN